MVAIPPRVTLPEGTIGVGTEGNIGIWNPLLGRWGDLGTAGDSRVRSLARIWPDQLTAVTADGSLRTWVGDRWSAPLRMGNWALNMLDRRYDNVFLGVDTAGRIGMFGSTQWFEQPNGGWTLKMLTWTPGLQLVGVGTNGNVGVWSGGGWTGGDSLMGGWTLKMVAFDESAKQWCVGTQGNVGLWNGQGWTDLGLTGGWTLDWLCFT